MPALPELAAIENALEAYFAQHRHRSDTELKLRLWVGLSGGVDSSLLLSLLAQAKSHLSSCSIDLHAIHINHQLQPEAQSWAQWAQKRCEELGVPITVVSANVEDRLIKQKGIEAAARQTREAIFFEQCLYSTQAQDGSESWLVLGHHADDQLETQLYRWVRGTTVKGLGGMAVFDSRSGLMRWRPLLGVSRDRILELARQFSLSWVDDPSNVSDQFDRNFLRHKVVPLLKQRWPAVLKTTARCGEHLRETGDVMFELVDQVLRMAAGIDEAADQWPQEIDLKVFVQGSRARSHLLLYRWLQHQGWHSLNQNQVHEIFQSVVMAQPSAQPSYVYRDSSLKGFFVLRRFHSRLYICTEQAHNQRAKFNGSEAQSSLIMWNFLQQTKIELSAGVLECRDAILARQLCQAFVCENTNKASCFSKTPGVEPSGSVLEVIPRQWVPKQKLPKRLKQRFQEASVPPWLRDNWPVLFLGDSLIGVPQVCYSAEFERCFHHLASKKAFALNALFSWKPV